MCRFLPALPIHLPHLEAVMPLKNCIGVDHVVITVRDLDAAARTWADLGFTIAPRGVHSAHMGTGNHTIMLAEDYIELLGVLAPTERNLPTRQFLTEREGLERIALTALDAGGLAEELKLRGLAAIGPVPFSRPVDLGGGRTGEARFETTQWPLDRKPGGMQLFACQHFTRETVWLPDLVRQPNTATRIDRIECVSANPKSAAEEAASLIASEVQADGPGRFRVESGRPRAAFVFLSRDALAAAHPGIALDGVPAEGAVTLALKVDSASALTELSKKAGAVTGMNRVTFPPSRATGVLLEFSLA
jgi:catechol 2,3-dioxygenase-like lactoylglutathione lyase family enzyme